MELFPVSNPSVYLDVATSSSHGQLGAASSCYCCDCKLYTVAAEDADAALHLTHRRLLILGIIPFLQFTVAAACDTAKALGQCDQSMMQGDAGDVTQHQAVRDGLISIRMP